jgi:predicted ATPase
MALFLKSCKLLKEYRDIKPFSITFSHGINIVVGENGSGKSTLLNLLTNTSDFKDTFSVKVEPQTTFRFLDTEKHNPRIKNNCADSKNIGFEISSRFLSHGETMMPLLSASKDFENILLFVDEPEAGLSLRNQKKLLTIFENISLHNNCQIILTTHSYIFIKSREEVFSMNEKNWIKSKDFLKGL